MMRTSQSRGGCALLQQLKLSILCVVCGVATIDLETRNISVICDTFYLPLVAK